MANISANSRNRPDIVNDVFGLLPATRGNVPERTKMTAKIQPSGQRRGRVTEDREKSVGARLFLIQLITEGSGWGARLFLSQLIYPSTPPPPIPFTCPGPERRGGDSQRADPGTREEEGGGGG